MSSAPLDVTDIFVFTFFYNAYFITVENTLGYLSMMIHFQLVITCGP